MSTIWETAEQSRITINVIHREIPSLKRVHFLVKIVVVFGWPEDQTFNKIPNLKHKLMFFGSKSGVFFVFKLFGGLEWMIQCIWHPFWYIWSSKHHKWTLKFTKFGFSKRLVSTQSLFVIINLCQQRFSTSQCFFFFVEKSSTSPLSNIDCDWARKIAPCCDGGGRTESRVFFKCLFCFCLFSETLWFVLILFWHFLIFFLDFFSEIFWFFPDFCILFLLFLDFLFFYWSVRGHSGCIPRKNTLTESLTSFPSDRAYLTWKQALF